MDTSKPQSLNSSGTIVKTYKMVKQRTEFNYFGMKPLDTARGLFLSIFFIITALATILIVPAIINSADFIISWYALLIIYLVVLEVLFFVVCLLTKFDLSPGNVLLIKVVLLPFALVLSPLCLLLYFAIKYNLNELIKFIIGVLTAMGIFAGILFAITIILGAFIYFNMFIAEALGQKPKNGK